jgi:hypothetical protein
LLRGKIQLRAKREDHHTPVGTPLSDIDPLQFFLGEN